MALYNFQPRFAKPIEAGDKTHTIRDKRKRRTKPGEVLYLYTGLRHANARRIMVAVCTKVQDIEIRALLPKGEVVRAIIDGDALSGAECELLAMRDGFVSWAEMLRFWDGRLPFKGDIVHWRPFKAFSECDWCWCEPFDGPIHPDCPAHGRRRARQKEQK